MKKYIVSIILIALNFSSANAMSIEDVLNTDTGVETFKIQAINLNEYNFRSASLAKTYNNLKVLDGALKPQIIKLLEEGKLEHYEVNGLIDEYENFVYYVNEMFFYIDLIDKGNNDEEFYFSIKENYSLVVDSYNKIQNIFKK